jgi:hypothetical protein
VNDKTERARKERAVAYFKVFADIFRRKLRKTTNKYQDDLSLPYDIRSSLHRYHMSQVLR